MSLLSNKRLDLVDYKSGKHRKKTRIFRTAILGSIRNTPFYKALIKNFIKSKNSRRKYKRYNYIKVVKP